MYSLNVRNRIKLKIEVAERLTLRYRSVAEHRGKETLGEG
jgi:hypothetical protein